MTDGAFTFRIVKNRLAPRIYDAITNPWPRRLLHRWDVVMDVTSENSDGPVEIHWNLTDQFCHGFFFKRNAARYIAEVVSA